MTQEEEDGEKDGNRSKDTAETGETSIALIGSTESTEIVNQRIDINQSPGKLIKPSSFVIICVCAFLSVLFMNVGLLSFIFLVPFGFAVIVFGSSWLPFFINFAFIIVARFITHGNSAGMWPEVFYSAVMFLCFFFVMSQKYSQIRTAYRMIIAAAAGTAVFIIYMFGINSSAFNFIVASQAEFLSSIMMSSISSDAVLNSTFQQFFAVDKIVSLIKLILLRGGALTGVFFLFFINRYISGKIAVLLKKKENERGLIKFFAPVNTIWALSSSLLLILLTRLTKLEILEVFAWNIFIICAIVYLAQGAGILNFLLAKFPISLKIIVNVFIVMIVLSPGINTVFLILLVILGIAENWLPLRVKKEKT